MSCGNNNNTTQNVCGTWEDVTDGDRDVGACWPRRVKITCEKPPQPTPDCPDEEFELVYTPDDTTSPFTVIGSLLDENCEPILDENDEHILTIIS